MSYLGLIQWTIKVSGKKFAGAMQLIELYLLSG